MSKPLRILHLEDSPTEAELISRELRRAGFDPQSQRVETEAEFMAGLETLPDVILADYALPHYDGLRALARLRDRGLDIPFILISGALGEEAAVAAIKQGATDYLLKDRLTRLGTAVEHALAEQQRRAAQQQAAAEQEKLAAQNRQLQKTESLGRMAGAIAHHFNNQLAAVMGNLELAQNELPPNSEAGECLAAALKSAHKAATMSELMLTYLGQTKSQLEPLDLAEVCQRTLPLLEVSLPKTVVLVTDLPTPGPVISGNRNQIQQVLSNLFTNAWEASGTSPGALQLAVKTVAAAAIPGENRFPIDWQPQATTYACLEVADHDGGIKPADLEKIFDPFFTSKFPGRGLGLPVVLGIVRKHGGVVTVASGLGQGSTFRVFLPVVAAIPQKPTLVVPVSQPTGSGGAVLVVEDEPALLKVTTRMLESIGGFTVFGAADGAAAVELFRQHQAEIGCVLCDLTMPRMNGWATMAALRELAPGLPIILTSGYDEARVLAGHDAERPQAFLGKPYAVAALINAVQKALSAAAPRPG